MRILTRLVWRDAMSEEGIAGLVTVTFIVGLIAWVPCLHGVNGLIRADERRSRRYGWRRAYTSGRSEGDASRKVFHPS